MPVGLKGFPASVKDFQIIPVVQTPQGVLTIDPNGANFIVPPQYFGPNVIGLGAAVGTTGKRQSFRKGAGGIALPSSITNVDPTIYGGPGVYVVPTAKTLKLFSLRKVQAMTVGTDSVKLSIGAQRGFQDVSTLTMPNTTALLAVSCTASASDDTITTGSTGTLANGNSIQTGTPVVLSGTTAPAGTVFGTTYYAIRLSFWESLNIILRLATTPENAFAGTFIDMTTTGTSVNVATLGLGGAAVMNNYAESFVSARGEYSIGMVAEFTAGLVPYLEATFTGSAASSGMVMLYGLETPVAEII